MTSPTPPKGLHIPEPNTTDETSTPSPKIPQLDTTDTTPTPSQKTSFNDFVVIIGAIGVILGVFLGIPRFLMESKVDQRADHAEEPTLKNIREQTKASEENRATVADNQKTAKKKAIADTYGAAIIQINSSTDGIVINGINTIKRTAIENHDYRWESKVQLGLTIKNNSRSDKGAIKEGRIKTTNQFAVKAIGEINNQDTNNTESHKDVNGVDEFINLDRANLRYEDLISLNLSQVSLKESKLSFAVLQNSNLKGAFLQGSNLEGADLQGANLEKASLHKAWLHRTMFDRAFLQKANLSKSDLLEASLDGANLSGANLKGASLVKTKLSGTILDGANLHGADLRGVKDFDPDLIKKACNWNYSIYDQSQKKKLGLGENLTINEIESCSHWR